MSTDHNEQQLVAALKHIARNETIKAYVLQHAPLYAVMQQLFTSGHPCSIATHDLALLDYAHSLIQEHGLDSTHIEFEMLHGVTPDRLHMMRDRGYRTRVYLPYGQEWYLYLCHRLAEYPPNVYQAIIDAVATDL